MAGGLRGHSCSSRSVQLLPQEQGAHNLVFTFKTQQDVVQHVRGHRANGAGPQACARRFHKAKGPQRLWFPFGAATALESRLPQGCSRETAAVGSSERRTTPFLALASAFLTCRLYNTVKTLDTRLLGRPPEEAMLPQEWGARSGVLFIFSGSTKN